MRQSDNTLRFSPPWLLGLAMATSAGGAGFQLSEHSTNGLGRELANFHQLTDRLALHLGMNWSSWSRFESLTANIEGTIVGVKHEDWQDTCRFSVSTTYQHNEAILLRAGVGYAITNSSIDLGLSYIHFRDTDISEAFRPQAGSPLPADELVVKASGQAWLVGAQYSYQF